MTYTKKHSLDYCGEGDFEKNSLFGFAKEHTCLYVRRNIPDPEGESEPFLPFIQIMNLAATPIVALYHLVAGATVYNTESRFHKDISKAKQSTLEAKF